MKLRGAQALIHPLPALFGWIVFAAAMAVGGIPRGVAGWIWVGCTFVIFWLVWLLVLPRVRRVI